MSTIREPSSPAPSGTSAGMVERLCEYLERSEEADFDILCDFAREFYAKVPRQLLGERTLEQLAALTRGAFRFLDRSRVEGVSVEALNPEEEGWSAPVTIIRAEVRDRPFIVDTIREYLNAESLPIQHYVYPVLGIRRSPDGRIVEVAEPAEADARALVHCEVPRIEQAERREEIRAGVERRLEDVVVATDDFRPMLDALESTVERVRVYGERLPDRAAEFQEIEEFLNWLCDENFVFLGYRAYDIVESDGERLLRVEPRSGLGILRHEAESTWSEGTPIGNLSDALRKRVLEGPFLITSKTNAISTVHRASRMDYIGVKKLSSEGEVVGERRFLGLFTSKAYAENAETIPILRQKLDAVIQESGAIPGSHDFKEIITIFNSMPKEDLFQASPAELNREVQTVLDLLFSDEVHLTLRPDPLGRGVSVMVILPRGKFSGEVRQRIQESLTRRFEGEVLNYHLAMSAGDQARLHFHVSSSPELSASVDPDAIAKEIRHIIRSWDDRFLDELIDTIGAAEARQLAPLYSSAFPAEYRAATLPEVAVRDLEEFEALRTKDGSVAITLREPRGRGRAEAFRDVSILKLYLIGERLVLSDFMPILENAGLRVIEVAPFALVAGGLPEMMIYSFAVQDPETGRVPAERATPLAESLLAIRAGETPNDPFNALVLRAGLRWREVDVIRTYANFAFQSGLVPTRYGTARALANYPDVARLLVHYFGSRFDPAIPRPETNGDDGSARLRTALTSAIETVTTLSDDRAIRRLVSLIDATTRTNYFQRGGADPTAKSGGASYISIKIRSNAVEELRRTRLMYEIFVFSARMEGVHLRGAPVSRGGIRWSDRLDDFRTEVLGLVQTQIVKNAVIVPGGSKGGFITKLALADRESMMEEAAEQYRTLIRGMLDLTDNIVDGEIAPPPGVIRYDEDDPYLVVAADKGTAHLSDVANAVAVEYGFWLGDAFASGGSHGYDHKKEGITARGAWECVRRHFREMGKDIQKEPFTVAGVGDMSGDVFGNGMLLSRQTRLVAAFDHRHIFIDPDPDPQLSYAERRRLYGLPRSSWDDYDRSRLSPGAMIVPRGSKEVELTPEARGALAIEEGVSALDGESLIRAVLRAPVELFWNGGIGTYVKAAEETKAEVGDTSNDPVRVNAEEVRCSVIGEGGNLGLTQRARIVYALGGGRLNTDAIDNSGGVDMSDHEVNLKILFAPDVQSGKMSFEERNALLDEMTDDVSRLVLRDNIGQSLAVSLDEIRSRVSLADFTGLISTLERDRVLDRTVEAIPGAEELHDRASKGRGLTRPTLCVLLAYAKLRAQASLLESGFPDEPAAERYLIDYFPGRAVEAMGLERLRRHRLRREIIATQLANDLINLMGAAFLDRVAKDTGRDRGTVAAAWYVASRISGAVEIRNDLEAIEPDYPAATVHRWQLGLARVLERTTRWVLGNVEAEAPLEVVIETLTTGLSKLRREFGSVVTGGDRALFEERMRELTDLGIEDDLARRLITLRFLPELLDILRIARESDKEPLETAEAYYLVSDRLNLGWLQQLLRGVSPEEPWEKRFAQALIADLQKAQRAISRGVLNCRRAGEPIGECLTVFERQKARETEAYVELIRELRGSENPPVAAAGVAVRALLGIADR